METARSREAVAPFMRSVGLHSQRPGLGFPGDNNLGYTEPIDERQSFTDRGDVPKERLEFADDKGLPSRNVFECLPEILPFPNAEAGLPHQFSQFVLPIVPR